MAHTKPTWRDKLAYRLDNLMSLNPLAKLVMLALVSVLVILIGGTIYSFIVERTNIFKGWWMAWLYLADTGNQADADTDLTRLVALLITIAGMLVFALLLGIVSESLGEKLEALKKGRSRVVETGHTLILGWEEKIFALLGEIIAANSNQRRGVIVILAERDKQEMEEEISRTIPDTGTTIIVCRSGAPTDVLALHKVNAPEARSVVVLGDPRAPEESDTRAIKTVLALQRGVGELKGHLTVEIMDSANKPIVEMIGQGNVEVVLPRDIMGRLMVQTARQNGLAQTYGSLLGFAGSEFYVQGYAPLTGKRFAEVWPLFPDAVICGLVLATPRPEGRLWINPPDETVLAAGDELLILAEDDDTFAIKAPPAQWQPSAAPMAVAPSPPPTNMLFLGWRRDIGVMLRELDAYATEGSTLTIVSTLNQPEFAERLKQEGVTALSKTKLKYAQANLASRKDLEALKVEQYDSVLLLADETEARTPDEVDARTLLSLLLIRDIQRSHDVRDRPVLSEIRDPRTKELAKVAEASDYVVSNEIIAMLLANISENRAMNAVWSDLFSSEGSEIYLKNALRYARPQETVTFYDLMARARSIGETALGYLKAGGNPLINPADKSEALSFTEADRVIVLAEDDR